MSYKPDGTVDVGIPDNWAQAAVLNAMVEGLAGVVDKGQLFDQVELSPRWLAAGKNEVDITIGYGPSGKSVSYHYKHHLQHKTISLTVQGSPSWYTIRQLLPTGKYPKRVTVDGKTRESSVEKIKNSQYVVVKDVIGGLHTIKVSYRGGEVFNLVVQSGCNRVIFERNLK